MATQVTGRTDAPGRKGGKPWRYVDGGFPLMGNLPQFNRDRLAFLRHIAEMGDVIGLRFGPFPGLFFNRPEHVQSILVDRAYDFDKGEIIHTVFRPVIGIGNHFALMEGHLLLATLAQRVSFALVPGQRVLADPVHHLTMRPQGAVNVTVKTR